VQLGISKKKDCEASINFLSKLGLLHVDPDSDGFRKIMIWEGRITINVPVVFMARYVMILKGAKKSRFSGPTPTNAPNNDVAPLKIITYRAIKITGTLVVLCT
jgi:hypothetical protein